MVRTYHFNPSTQSSSIELQPFQTDNNGLKNNNNALEPLQKSISFQVSRPPDKSSAEPNSRSCFSPPWIDEDDDYNPFEESSSNSIKQQQNGFEKSVENGYANLSYLKKMPCDLQPPTATENRNVVNNDKVSLSIEDEQTTVLGIRSVIINGQRFYQPVDVTTTASGARGGPTSGLWEKSYSAGVPVSMLATAVKIMNNGKNHNNISGNYQQQSRRDAFSPPSFCAPSSVNNNPMASGQPQFQRKQQQQTSAAGFQRQRCNSFSPPPPHLPLLLQRSSMNGGGSLAKMRTSSLRRSTDSANGSFGEDALPWARGNPQPKSGKRGSNSWMSGQFTLPSIHENYDASKSFNNNNKLDASMMSTTSTYTVPLPFSASRTNFNGGDPYWADKMEKERHKMELLRQIEENKHRKFMERQKELEVEDRERRRNEQYQQRICLEMEEERRKEKEKALLAERKAAQIEAVKAATVAAIQKETEAKKQKTGGTRKSRAKESEEEATAEDGGGVGGEEWWERKDRRRAEELAAAAAGRSTSPVIPSLGRRNEQIVDSGLSSENGDKENSPQQEEREYVGDHRFSPSSSRARSLNPRNPRRNNVPSRRDSNESFSSGFSGGGNDRRSKSYSRDNNGRRMVAHRSRVDPDYD